MDGNTKNCNERGHHEFGTLTPTGFDLQAKRQLLNVECLDCGMKAIKYLHAGWVHPE